MALEFMGLPVTLFFSVDAVHGFWFCCLGGSVCNYERTGEIRK